MKCLNRCCVHECVEWEVGLAKVTNHIRKRQLNQSTGCLERPERYTLAACNFFFDSMVTVCDSRAVQQHYIAYPGIATQRPSTFCTWMLCSSRASRNMDMVCIRLYSPRRIQTVDQPASFGPETASSEKWWAFSLPKSLTLQRLLTRHA